ncbi:diphosphomevalonate decarboxylase [Patescibacteria group bacterium]|nr:diphosphomevalonate decarboxylase [Patescibacteria group bacterium]
MKATAIANSNIAFVKYWGKANPKLFIPTRNSLSMTVNALNTQTTVEFSKDYEKDTLFINEEAQVGKLLEKVIRHLDNLRRYTGVSLKATVISKNNFPKGAGLASSASGFAALTVASCVALGLGLNDQELSVFSRQGSGSSCRSIKGGFVEWIAGEKSEESFAYQLYDENYWDIRDIIAIVKSEEKKVSSRVGMAASLKTCPLYDDFVKIATPNIKQIKEGLTEKNFEKIGEIIEFENFLLHTIMTTTRPPLLYWSPDTFRIIQEVSFWRKKGIQVYCTVDAGPNVHLITLPEYALKIENKLKQMPSVIQVIHNKPGGDAKITNEHLF